jgi:Flp pilus assembly protein TadD
MAKDPLDNLREKAQQALSRGQYQEARQIYQQALGYRSDHPDLHYGIATVCFVLSDFHSAIYHFKEVIRLDPLRAGAYVNLGAVYNRLGQHEDALAALRRGIQLDTNRAEGYYNLALVYKHLGQLDMAINAYRESLRVNPRMFDAHYNLGNIFFEKGQLAHAIAHYRQALEIRPKWEKAKNALESALTEQARLESSAAPAPAKSVADKDSRLDPNRLLDPTFHGRWMQELHQLVIETDNNSQTLLDSLHKEVENAIREMSISILNPADPRHNLEAQLQKMDHASAHLQQMQENLQKSMTRIRVLTDHIAKI